MTETGGGDDSGVVVPADIRSVLQSLYDQHARLDAELVLEEASRPESILHDRLIWDNREAAHRYRLHVCRQWIVGARIVVRVDPQRTIRTRAFVKDTPGGQYMPAVDAMNDPAKRQIVLEQAHRELEALRAKYQNLLDWQRFIVAAAEQAQGHEGAA